MKATMFVLVMSCALTGTTTAGAECALRQELRDDRRSVDSLVGVAKRDRAFISGYGIVLETHGIGGTYAPRAALFAALDASNCDPELEKWIKRKARHPRKPDDL